MTFCGKCFDSLKKWPNATWISTASPNYPDEKAPHHWARWRDSKRTKFKCINVERYDAVCGQEFEVEVDSSD